jgi:hypothetical protein
MVETFYPGRIVIDGTPLAQALRGLDETVLGRVGAGLARTYEADTRAILQRLLQSNTGRAVLEVIEDYSNTNRYITISPDLDVECNAHSGAGVVVSRGLRIGNPSQRLSGGISSTIDFSPQKWVGGQRCSQSAGEDATEVLMHELIHSLRALTGHRASQTLLYYNNYEEFYAVLLTNIFSSEVGRRLRSGYSFPDPALDPNQPDLAGFANRYRQEIERLIHENLDLCTRLARAVNAPFNPIRYMRPSGLGGSP